MKRLRNRKLAMMLVWILLLTLALPGTMLTALAEGEEPAIEQPAEEPADEQPPAEEEQPPVEEEQPPVEEEQPPVEEEQPPVEEEQPPVEEEQPPAEEEQPPAEEEAPEEQFAVMGIEADVVADISDIVFVSKKGNCSEISAKFENMRHYDMLNGDMKSHTTWELYWIAAGDPAGGAVIASGAFNKLNEGDDRTLTYDPYNNPNGPNGEYKFKVYQSNPAKSPVWSTAISVSGCKLPHLNMVSALVDKPAAWPGETVRFTFKVHNDGDFDLNDVQVKDSLPGTPKSGGDDDIDMDGTDYDDEGDVRDFILDYKIPDAARGTITNSAYAEGKWKDPHPDQVIQSNTLVPEVIVKWPGIDLEKTADKSEAFPGEVVTYSFEVTNTGTIPLYNIQLNDSDIGYMDSLNELAAGETHTFTKEYTVPCSLENDGPSVQTMLFINTATVTGCIEDTGDASVSCEPNDPPKPPSCVSDEDSFTLTLKPSHPSLYLKKDVYAADMTPSDFDASERGERCLIIGSDQENVYYQFRVKNNGDVPLYNVTVSDPMLPGSPFNLGTILPGEWAVSDMIPYNIEEAEFPLINEATATGHTACGTEVNDTDGACVDLASIALEKTVSIGEMTPVDELAVDTMMPTVTYHFLVTNTGSVGLNNIVVTDEYIGYTSEPISLGSGESHEFTTSFLFDGEEWDENGKFINWAKACGTSGKVLIGDISVECIGLTVCSPLDDATVTYVPPGQPAIDIEKTVNDTSVLTGTTVTYTLTVTNTGDLPLYNVLVSDQELGFSETIPVMQPDDVVQFTIDEQLTTGDRNSGNSFVNTATATGNTCDEPPISETTASSFIYQVECLEVSDEDSISVLIRTRTGGGGGGGGGTTTTTVEPEPVPEAVPEVIPAPAPEPAPVILEEAVPLGVPVLPKTGEMNPALFYGLGGAFAALGLLIRRRF